MRRLLLFALFLLGTCLRAQERPSLLTQGATEGAFSCSGSGCMIAIVPVDRPPAGHPFTQALRLRNTRNSANPWDIRIITSKTVAAAKGDTYVATFWLRAIQPSSSGYAFSRFVVERNASPYDKSAEWSLAVGTEWKKFQVPFTINDNYSPGGYSVHFWMTFEPQEFELGGLTILFQGQNVPYGSLNLENYPYEGTQADAPWRVAAAARIDRLRKADIAVAVRDDAGNPVPNAAVRVRMKRHAFGFGTAVAADGLLDTSPNGDRYRAALVANFNKIVFENDLKWGDWERSGTPDKVLRALRWLRENGINQIRGHNLIWPSWGYMPADVRNLTDAALSARIRDHIAQELSALQNEGIAEWDVINEPYTNHDVQDRLGRQIMGDWFQLARQTAPTPKLYINDYSIIEAGGFDMAHQDAYFNDIAYLDSLGAPVDGIGIQGHFNTNLTPPTRVLEILDRFATFKKDIQITEFDIDITDEAVQADYTRDLLTVVFSHPSIKGFLMWGFWEGRHWLPRGAMYRRDWSEKPNLKAYRDLVYGQWWTDVSGATDAGGLFHTRGFLGDYDVEVTVDGQTRTLPLPVAPGANTARFGNVAAGAVAAVTNAASFATGPVAPGEIVTIFGTGFGARELAQAGYDLSGRLASAAGDTRVFFDGVEAPLVYSLTGQVSAIVPYSVSGSTNVQVEFLGVKTAPLSVPVAPAAPGIFAYPGGKRAVVVNYYPDGHTELNSNKKPAATGDYIALFLTGEGLLDRQWTDGQMPSGAGYPAPAQPLTVRIGGAEAAVAFKGLIYPGVLQVNAIVPAGAGSGDVPLTVTVGSAQTQPDVTLTVR